MVIFEAVGYAYQTCPSDCDRRYIIVASRCPIVRDFPLSLYRTPCLARCKYTMYIFDEQQQLYNGRRD